MRIGVGELVDDGLGRERDPLRLADPDLGLDQRLPGGEERAGLEGAEGPVHQPLRLEPALDLVAQLFFLKLFRLDPGLRKKFDGPVEMQARKFSAGAKLAMISLGHEDGLAPTLKLLGSRHRQMGIRTRHYRTMSRALIWTLERSLEKSFDRDTREAWNTMLSQFTKVMSR